MKKKYFIIFAAIILTPVIFLGIEFIPGFFHGSKPENSKNISQRQTAPDASSSANPISDSPTKTEYTVKSASFLGLDTAIESAHFTIYAHKADAAKAEALIAICENEYPVLVEFFPKMSKTEILLTYNADEYVNTFTAAPPWGAQSYKDPNTSAGSFCPGCTKSLGGNTEYIYMLRPGNRSFAHELAHRYFWSNYPNLSKNNNLAWLNEGQAVFVQTEVSPGPGGLSGNLAKVNGASLPANFSALTQSQQTGNSATLENFYDLVGLMAYYIDAKTNGGIKNFLTDLNQTQNLDQTCQNKFGFNSNQLFANWKEIVSKTSGRNASDFLANYKTSIK